MSRKSKFSLIGVLVGVVIGLFAGACLGTFTWFANNPTVDEVTDVITSGIDLNEEEQDRIEQMTTVGAAIDFVINLLLYVVPASLVGGLIGFISARYWSKEQAHKLEGT